MEDTVGAGDNYWQVTDNRPDITGEHYLGGHYDTRAEADEALAALPGPGSLYATHDDGRCDQFDWQLEEEKA